jgi:PhzF family phenazine biosynthesis protein
MNPLFQVDAFAERPFEGNPAGVCVLDEAADPGWMQAVAAEMNLSETAFLVRRAPGDYDLRWFTPTVEVDLCGHATLGSAHILWTENYADEETLRFQTRSGELRARRDGASITLDFPVDPAAVTEAPSGLDDALGARVVAFGNSPADRQIAELESEEAVRALTPDLEAIANLKRPSLIVTAPASMPGVDFVSRFFAPGFGIPEDPVTGSAHCTLAPWWAQRLGKTQMRAYQASARGGFLDVRLLGDRVEIGGRAVTVFRAQLD